MDDMDQSCETIPVENSFSKDNCCDNEFFYFIVDEEFEYSTVKNEYLDLDFVSAFLLVYTNQFNYNTKGSSNNWNYSPPLLNYDIPVMFQSFLI